MTVLGEICARKHEHIADRKIQTPLEILKEKIQHVPQPAGFIKTLKSHEFPTIISEVKKASPSRGIIREDFDPVEIAKTYEQSGACCLSVLTDEPYFQGCDDYLMQIKEATSLPVLRKDFMLDPYQIYESRALGADCVLLIIAALSDEQASELHECALHLGMDVLVEVHDEQELYKALNLNPAMVGINNRNLKTLEVDIQTSHDLAPHIPDHIVKIAESGISSRAEIQALGIKGYQGFLIGESLMREKNIKSALETLLQKN